MTSQRKVRVPFQPLSYNLEHLAQDNELMIILGIYTEWYTKY